MRKFFKALTLVSLTSVSAPVSAQDAVYQFYQISYQNAVEGCNVGYSPSCQMINKIPQFVMFYEEALRRCSNGNQQVCSDVRQLRVRATQGIAQDRREKANIYRTTPSTGFGGGKSPGEILGEANDITHGGYIIIGAMATARLSVQIIRTLIRIPHPSTLMATGIFTETDPP